MTRKRDAEIERRRRRFAAWLRDARKAARLTQEELSVKVDRTQSAVTNWESTGLEIMTPEEMTALATALEVEPVEVAAALGYPTQPTPIFSLPMPPHVLEERISDLSLRLGREVEAWTVETFPVAGEEPEPNAQSGGLS